MKTVVYFGSKEIYGDIKTAVNSLLANTKVDRVVVLTEGGLDINAEIIDISGQTWFNQTNLRTKWKMFGAIRTAFTKIFDEDIVLSLDADTIVTQDISELWDIDLTGYYFAAIREPYLSMLKPYYNTGVCLMNLKLLRATGKDDELIHVMNTQPLRYVSQDALNIYCDRILDLPSTYNACKFTAPTDNPKIIHYADRTDWRDLPEVKRYK